MADQGRLDELKRKFDENPRRYFAPLANEYRKAGEPDMAIELCRTYLPQQPSHMSGYIVYGQALHDAGRDDEAGAVFHQALGLDPENIIALRQLGDIARASGDSTGAIDWYRKVLDLDPRNDEIASFISALENPGAAPARDWSAPERPAPPPVRPEPEHVTDTLALEDLVAQPEWSRVTPTESFRARDTAPAPHDDTQRFEAPAESVDEPAEADAPFEAVHWREATPAEQRAAAEHVPAHELQPDDEIAHEPHETPHGELHGDLHEAPLEERHDEPQQTSSDALHGAGAHEDATPVDAMQYDEWSFDDAKGTLASLEDEHAAPDASALRFMGLVHDDLELDTRISHPVADESHDAHELHAEPREEVSPDATPDVSHDQAADELLKFSDFVPSESATLSTPASSSPFVTETMAELYMQQGLDGEALAIYRQLAVRRDDPSIRARIAELEKKTGIAPSDASRDAAGGLAAPAAVHPPTGESVRAFFTRIGARAPRAHAHIAPENEGGLTSLFGAERVSENDVAAAQSLAGAFPAPHTPTSRD